MVWCAKEELPDARRHLEVTSMAALEQSEEDFEAKVWNLISPMEGQHENSIASIL